MGNSTTIARLQWSDAGRYLHRDVADAPIVIGGRHGDIRVPGATVSRRHARIFRDEGLVWVEDLSGSGVWVNGTRVDRARLGNRDRIQVGSLELQFWQE